MAERLAALRTRFGLRATTLIFGVAFLALGVVGLGGQADGETAWLWVAMLAAAGIAGVAFVVRTIARGPDADQPNG